MRPSCVIGKFTTRVRRRFRLKYNRTDRRGVISPFKGYRSIVRADVPSVEIQNILFERLSKVPSASIEWKLIAASGNPFMTSRCTVCCEDLLISSFQKKRNALSRSCKSCDRDACKSRSVCEYSTVSQSALLLRFGRLLKARLPVDFDCARMFKKIKSAVVGGASKCIEYILAQGVAHRIMCSACGERQYMYMYRTDWKYVHGVRTKCNACTTLNTDVVSAKAFGMRVRGGGESGCMTRVFQGAIDRQQGLDYYSLVPFTSEHGSYLTPSPERLDRALKVYTDENTVACLCILNVGGSLNWSRRLVLQTLFAEELSLLHGPHDLLEKGSVNRFLSSSLSRCKTRCKARADRFDDAGELDITVPFLKKLLVRQGFRCAVSGIPLALKSNHPWLASLDRVDPKKGYVEDNVRFVVNRFNGFITWTPETFSFFYAQMDLKRTALVHTYVEFPVKFTAKGKLTAKSKAHLSERI